MYTRQLLGRFALIAGIVAGSLFPAAAADGLRPVIPEAQDRFSPSQGCVEPADEMRKNHMNYILHERDETVHEGIRGSRHSLAKCISCHVPPPSGGNKVRVDSEEHFCNSCHTYAAVHIDCFQCHSDQPAQMSQRSKIAPHKLKHTGVNKRPATLSLLSSEGSQP
ncbi:MAG: hypothetical protein V3R51_06215 [Gammaproteobacteria bacterium]